jgi:hypothetical protein
MAQQDQPVHKAQLVQQDQPGHKVLLAETVSTA